MSAAFAARLLWAFQWGGFIAGIGAASYVFAVADRWWIGALACLAYLGGFVEGNAKQVRR